MKNIKWVFLIYAIATTVCIAGIGVAVALRSTAGVIACIGLTVVLTGSGMKRKQRLRHNGQL